MPKRHHGVAGEFLRETIGLCRGLTDGPLLFRLDSGNDAAENMGILLGTGCHFIIKHNLRRESPESWLEMARTNSRDISRPREGKTVYVGSDWKKITTKDDDGKARDTTLRVVYEVVERSIDKHGQYLMPSAVEVNAFWTNLDFTDSEVISLYHAHGESEQFHSELKTDMDLERLPSGKFATNCLVIELAIIAYNILRMMGQESIGRSGGRLKRPVRRRRIRTVIANLIMMASHVTEHARRLRIGLGQSNVWRWPFAEIYYSFAYS